MTMAKTPNEIIPESQPNQTDKDMDLNENTKLDVSTLLDSSQDEKSERFDLRIRACFCPRSNARGKSTKEKNAANNIDITTAVKGLCNALLSLQNIEIYNKDKVKTFGTINNFPQCEESFDSHFETGKPNNNGSIDVYFVIRSKWKFTRIKNDSGIWHYLSSHNIFLHPQSFAKVEDMSEIGFLVGKHPKVTHQSNLIATITATLQSFIDEENPAKFEKLQYSEELDLTRTDVPQFEIYHRTIRHKHKEDGNESMTTIETEALQITTTRIDAPWLKALLVIVTSKQENMVPTGYFIPFQWRRQESTSFFNAIAMHNKWLHNISILPICGVPLAVMMGKRSDAMDENESNLTVMETFKALKGEEEESDRNIIFAVEQTSDTERIGKWFLVQRKEDFDFVSRTIDEELPAMCTDVPSFKEQKLETFRCPRRMIQNQYQSHAQAIENKETSILNAFMTLGSEPEQHLKPATHATHSKRKTTQVKVNRQVMSATIAQIPKTNAWLTPAEQQNKQGKKTSDKQAPITTVTQEEVTSQIASQWANTRVQLEEKLKTELTQTILKELEAKGSSQSTQATESMEPSQLSDLTASVTDRLRKDMIGEKNFKDGTASRLQKLEMSLKNQAIQMEELMTKLTAQQATMSDHRIEIQQHLESVTENIDKVSMSQTALGDLLHKSNEKLNTQISDTTKNVEKMASAVSRLLERQENEKTLPSTPAHTTAKRLRKLSPEKATKLTMTSPLPAPPARAKSPSANQDPMSGNYYRSLAPPPNMTQYMKHVASIPEMVADVANGLNMESPPTEDNNLREQVVASVAKMGGRSTL
jgi:hypothetical protein